MNSRFAPLLAIIILLCTGAATVLPAGQVTIVRDENGSRWRCETQKAARAVCVRQRGAVLSRTQGNRAPARVSLPGKAQR